METTSPKHLHDAACDGHGPHIEVAAIGLERGITDHLDQTVGEVYKESGQPQRDDLSDPARGKGHAVKFQPQDSPLPGEEFEHPHRRAALCDHSGQRRPLDSHIQHKDEHGVQDDIHHCAQPHRHHADLGKALRIDKGVHAQAHHNEKGAAEVDGEVGVGIGKGGLTGAEEIEHRALEQEKDQGGRRTQDQQQREGIAQNMLGLLIVSLPPADGAQRRAAHAAEVGKPHQNGDDGHGKSQSGERQMPGQPSEVHPVHHAVEDIDELRQRHRGRQHQNISWNASL